MRNFLSIFHKDAFVSYWTSEDYIDSCKLCSWIITGLRRGGREEGKQREGEEGRKPRRLPAR